MKRIPLLRLVGSSLLFGAALASCAKEPSTEPLSPSDANAVTAPEAPEATEPTTDVAEPTPESAPAPNGKRAPCTFGQDQTCNADPKVSALWGKCLDTGVCECNPGFELNPMGSCAPVK